MERESPFHSNKNKLLGVEKGSIVKGFFATNATASIIVLVLITIFLFKEGIGFLGMYRNSLNTYVKSGLEYVALLQDEREAFTTISREVNDIEATWITYMQQEQGKSFAETKEITRTPEAKAFFRGYNTLGSDLRDYVRDKTEVATALRDKFLTNENLRDTKVFIDERIDELKSRSFSFDKKTRNEYLAKLQKFINDTSFPIEERNTFKERIVAIENNEPLTEQDRQNFITFFEAEKNKIVINPVDFQEELKGITAGKEELLAINDELEKNITAFINTPFSVGIPIIDQKIEEFVELNKTFLTALPTFEERVQNWEPTADTTIFKSLLLFITGKDWTTASSKQDWYGLLPLLSGSLLISFIALILAIPFGVGAAIYVNQIARPKEKNLIKPYIELIDAVPSVVIGFFGVVVLGEFLRTWSQQGLEAPDIPVIGFMIGLVFDFLNSLATFVPFFPFQERLNAFTAGCLLALMAVPTVFTLTEDAINNVPKHFKEASLALGASHRQTILKVIVPCSISGIISAVMLGFGRVIGETMVVLLCAGNRIKIPDFSLGLGVFTEPVHTMTGIIAQEMGEVVKDSIHYRALFMVGIVLFFASLLINYIAQKVVLKLKKY